MCWMHIISPQGTTTMDRRAAIMSAQFRNAVKEPHEYLKFAMKSETETNIWYVLMSGFDGDEGEFAGGEYLVRVEMPHDFPFNPPQFYLMTQQGLYEVEKKVCISIGEYHKDQYRAALGVNGFCNQLVSGLIGWRDMGGGINIIKTTVAQKKAMAKASREYNIKHYPDILSQINSMWDIYSTKWDLTTIPQQLKIKLGLVPFDDGVGTAAIAPGPPAGGNTQ